MVPEAGALSPTVSPAPLGAAEIDPEAEAEAQTRPDAAPLDQGASPEAKVETLPPPGIDEDDSAPFPTLEASLVDAMADAAAAPPAEPGYDDEAQAPPPLPRHLHVVEAADSQDTARAPRPHDEDEGQDDAAPAVDPSARPRSARPRTGSRPAVREHNRPRGPSGRAFGTNPPRGPTPPPTVNEALQAQLEDFTPALRREESVIEEAEALRHRNLYRARRWLAKLTGRRPAPSSDGKPAVAQAGLRLASSIGNHTLSALRRFEKLPRTQQLVFALAPYLLALVLVAVLLGSSGTQAPAPAPAEAPAEKIVALDALAPEPPPATADRPTPSDRAEPKTEALALVAPPPARAPTALDAPDAAASVPSETTALPSEQRVLPRRSKLFVRADPKSRRPIRLRKGTVLTVFPTFPAAEGWRLVQTKKGTVGFVSALHLAGERDPKVDKRRRRRRRR